MVDVTDADREAAADVFDANGEDHFARMVRAGQCDDWKEVQAFMAHRLLGQQQMANVDLATLSAYESGLREGQRQGIEAKGWQDIASAPDEGAVAVLYCPSEIYHEMLSPSRNHAIRCEVAVFERGKWMEPGTGHSDFDEDWRPNPTHWMPLTAAPEAEQCLIPADSQPRVDQ